MNRLYMIQWSDNLKTWETAERTTTNYEEAKEILKANKQIAPFLAFRIIYTTIGIMVTDE